MGDEEPYIQMNGGIAELFYILDVGDYISVKLERVLNPLFANAIGHLACWAANLALWGVGIGFTARLVAEHII